MARCAVGNHIAVDTYRCSECGSYYCSFHSAQRFHGCSAYGQYQVRESRLGGPRRGIRWAYVFVAFSIAAFGLGLYLVPGTNVIQLAWESLFNASLFLFFVWGVTGLARRSNSRRAFAVLILLILVGVVYTNQQATIHDVSLKGAQSVYVAENAYLANYAASSATTTTNQATIPQGNATVSTILPILSTTSVSSAVAASSFSASTSSTAPVSGNWLVDSPSFVGSSAKIDTPPNYQTLLNFTLVSINKDRASAGLSPVSLSPVQSAQQHADSMAYFGYFSHWDPQGYKPYMRYSLLAGMGAVAENVGQTYCTTSPATSTLLYQAPCSLQTIENGLAASEWGMMNNDAACCANGHRDNILDPAHNRVSLGISYVPSTGEEYLVEDFEDSYLQLSQPIQVSSGQIQIVGTSTSLSQISQIQVYYDPTPHAMTVQQLDATFSYDPGTFVGGVFPPCSGGCGYYPGAVSDYATSWQVSGGSINISFSMADLFGADGPGVYTIYLTTGSSTGSALLTYSVFHSGP